jgi:hypothetical protein
MELDDLYTLTLHQLCSLFKDQTWNCMVVPKRKRSDYFISFDFVRPTSSGSLDKDFTKELAKQLLKAFPQIHPLTFASGVSFYKKGSIKDVDMISLR